MKMGYLFVVALESAATYVERFFNLLSRTLGEWRFQMEKKGWNS